MVIEAPCFEQITTAQVSEFIPGQVQIGLHEKRPIDTAKFFAACSIGR